MRIFPAIDLYNKSAVRLYKGDYSQMTIYDNNPLNVVSDFKKCGAEYLHLVDLEGAKFGTTPNIDVVEKITKTADMFVEIGGGIRSAKTVEQYLNIGVNRIILGTAAITNRDFLLDMLNKHGDKIAVGVDIKEGCVAIKGWTEKSQFGFEEFCKDMQKIGVTTLVCTDISKDGAMKGTNRELYKTLSKSLNINITASGGVSSIEDVEALKKLSLYGAIIGKAYYTKAIDLAKAVEVAK